MKLILSIYRHCHLTGAGYINTMKSDFMIFLCTKWAQDVKKVRKLENKLSKINEGDLYPKSCEKT